VSGLLSGLSPSLLAVLGLAIAAIILHALWRSAQSKRESGALATLEDMAALGEVVPDTMHPVVDVDRCIGSGACVRACPEKNVLEVVHGQATLVNPLACVGHAACVAACPVQALRVVFGTATRGVELPRVDLNFQTSRAGLYVIGELAGMGLIRNAVRQGRQAADHVVAGSRRGDANVYDALVVGAGPAGVSATLRLLEAGLRVALVDREGLGGTILHYPRAKVVMTGALELPIIGTVRRRKMSKEELVALWSTINERAKLPLIAGVLVDGVTEASGAAWEITTSQGPMRAANVLLALGRRGTPRKLGIPGEDLAKVHYRLLEPAEFRGKHVLVVGGGNSAVENALSLADAGGCASVSISYRRAAFARCRADNRRRIDEYIAGRRVKPLMPSEVVKIEPAAAHLTSEGKAIAIPNDAVIVQIGGTAPSELLAKFGVEMVTKFGEA
jgi:thioredoxin reductase (NADPH)